MDFGILGPIQVEREGRPVPVPSRKQRIMLGVLLCHPDRVVSVDRLSEAAWPDGGAGHAAGKRVQLCVHRLRRVLGAPELLTWAPPGYRLRVGPDRLDAGRFEALVSAGQRPGQPPGDRVRTLRAALALWRGSPFADIDDVPELRGESLRLAELCCVAEEELVDAELAAGRRADLVPRLTQLVGAHPLRERLRGQLMIALRDAGRAPEALEVYRAGRRLLVDELGVEPGAWLREVHRTVLTGLEPAGREPAGREPAGLGPGRSGATGRRALLVRNAGPFGAATWRGAG